MAKLFARGYESSRAEKERQDKVRENMGKRLWKFFLKDGDEEAGVHFLTEEPVNFYEHNIKTGDNKFDQYTCTKEDCPDCADGDRATFKSAYLIVDHREYEYTDKDGKKHKGKDQVRLFVQGMKVASQLDRISTRYGLSNRDVTIIRLGKGTQTTYTVEKGVECKYTEKQIRDLLPEKLRDMYDGTQNSLMDIVEEQLLMHTRNYQPDEEDGEEEEGDDGRDKLIGMGDEEELPFKEDKKPKLTAGGSKKKSLFKKPQDSRKPQPVNKAKHLLRRG